MYLRRFALASSVLLAGTLAAAPAFAQASPVPQSDTFDVSGEVLEVSTVEATATAGATALTLGGGGTAQTDVIVQVADVVVSTNRDAGVSMTAARSEDGLTQAGTTDKIAYDLHIVADAAAAPGAGAFASGDTSSAVLPDKGETEWDVYIRYNTPAFLNPGTYSDTVTVTITARD